MTEQGLIQDVSGDFQFSETTVTVMGTGVQLCKPDVTRWLLLIHNPDTGSCWISTRPTVGINFGILCQTSTLPLVWYFRDHALLTTQAWYGASTVSVRMTVIEIFYRPSAANPELITPAMAE